MPLRFHLLLHQRGDVRGRFGFLLPQDHERRRQPEDDHQGERHRELRGTTEAAPGSSRQRTRAGLHLGADLPGLQIGGEIRRGAIAVGRVLRQALQADRFEFARDRRHQLARRQRFLRKNPQDHGHEVGVVAALEDRLARQQAIEGGAQGVDVGAAVAVAARAELLGGRVFGGAADAATRGGEFIVAVEPFGQAEVAQFHAAGRVDQDVARLDVAVDEAGFVNPVDDSRQLEDRLRGLGGREHALGLEPLGQGATGHELGHQHRIGTADVEVVQPHERGIVQARQRVGLERETLPVAVLAQPGVEHLHGDGALGRVGGQEDYAEAAVAEFALHGVTALPEFDDLGLLPTGQCRELRRGLRDDEIGFGQARVGDVIDGRVEFELLLGRGAVGRIGGVLAGGSQAGGAEGQMGFEGDCESAARAGFRVRHAITCRKRRRLKRLHIL